MSPVETHWHLIPKTIQEALKTKLAGQCAHLDRWIHQGFEMVIHNGTVESLRPYSALTPDDITAARRKSTVYVLSPLAGSSNHKKTNPLHLRSGFGGHMNGDEKRRR
jgi:hypothetical protein